MPLRVLAVFLGFLIAVTACSNDAPQPDASVAPVTSLPVAMIIGEPCQPFANCAAEVELAGVTYWVDRKVSKNKVGPVIAVAEGEFSEGITIRSVKDVDPSMAIVVRGKGKAKGNIRYTQMPFDEVAGPLIRAGLPPNPDGDYMMAEVGGELELVDDCLLASGDLVVWPYGTTWNDETQELTLDNGEVARLGDVIVGGGGQARAESVAQRGGPAVAAWLERCNVNELGLSSMNPNPKVTPANP